jgi:hypothetical protein
VVQTLDELDTDQPLSFLIFINSILAKVQKLLTGAIDMVFQMLLLPKGLVTFRTCKWTLLEIWSSIKIHGEGKETLAHHVSR